MNAFTTLKKAIDSKNKYWVQMHGNHESGTFPLPPNVFVVFTSTPGGYGIGSEGLMLPSPVMGHVREEEAVISSLILQTYPTYSVTYTPGMLVPRLGLRFDRRDPWCGIRKAPVVRSIISGNNVNRPSRQTATTIILNKRMGFKNDLPYGVRIAPDIFRPNFPVLERYIDMSLDYVIDFLSSKSRPTARNPLVVLVNSCRDVENAKNIHAILKHNRGTPGYAGFTRPPRMLTTQKNILAWALKPKKKRTINDRTASNAELLRAVQLRSNRDAIRHVKRYMKPGVILDKKLNNIKSGVMRSKLVRNYNESTNENTANDNTRHKRQRKSQE